MPEYLYSNDIKSAIIKNNIHYWYPFECSICGCSYGFYFENGNVIFNGACDCGSIFGERLASYQEIADIYNNNKDEQFRLEMLKYFKLPFDDMI